jgi:cell division protein FtsB
MDLWTMIVLIVLIGTGAGVISDYLKTQRVKAGKLADADGGQLQAEVEALRKRVAVLEKIVTDQRYELSRELDALERTG